MTRMRFTTSFGARRHSPTRTGRQAFPSSSRIFPGSRSGSTRSRFVRRIPARPASAWSASAATASVRPIAAVRPRSRTRPEFSRSLSGPGRKTPWRNRPSSMPPRQKQLQRRSPLHFPQLRLRCRSWRFQLQRQRRPGSIWRDWRHFPSRHLVRWLFPQANRPNTRRVGQPVGL